LAGFLAIYDSCRMMNHLFGKQLCFISLWSHWFFSQRTRCAPYIVIWWTYEPFGYARNWCLSQSHQRV
jgi:hypothetical protein